MLSSIAAEGLVWALVVFLLAVLLGVAVLLYRRRYVSTRYEQIEGYTLGDIRQMHKDGQISDEEYERMRKAVLGVNAESQGDPGASQDGKAAPMDSREGPYSC